METPAVSAPLEIDYDRISESVASRLAPAQEETPTEPDPYDYDARLSQADRRAQEAIAMARAAESRVAAFAAIPNVESEVLKQIPEHLRGHATDHVRATLQRLAKENPEVLSSLNAQTASDLAALAAGKAAMSGGWRPEPAAAPVGASSIPNYDKVVSALRQVYPGREFTHEEIADYAKGFE